MSTHSVAVSMKVTKWCPLGQRLARRKDTMAAAHCLGFPSTLSEMENLLDYSPFKKKKIMVVNA